MTDEAYTKHYYIEGERICSKIGSGFGLAPYDPLGEPVNVLSGAFSELPDSLLTMVQRSAICAGYEGDITISGELKPAHNAESDPENDQYFYHPDHLGSSSYITDLYGNGIQHLQYLPFGETFVDQQTGVWNTPYKFSGKEKDDETGYSYFGARYYDSDLSVWLSVDPMAGKYPGLSPYEYCHNNPIRFIDPIGLEPGDPKKKKDPNADYVPSNGCRTISGTNCTAHRTFWDIVKNSVREFVNFLEPNAENEKVAKSTRNWGGYNFTSKNGHGHDNRTNRTKEAETQNIDDLMMILTMPGEGRLSKKDVENVPKFTAILTARILKALEIEQAINKEWTFEEGDDQDRLVPIKIQYAYREPYGGRSWASRDTMVRVRDTNKVIKYRRR